MADQTDCLRGVILLFGHGATAGNVPADDVQIAWRHALDGGAPVLVAVLYLAGLAGQVADPLDGGVVVQDGIGVDHSES